jgi:hypothetical protein
MSHWPPCVNINACCAHLDAAAGALAALPYAALAHALAQCGAVEVAVILGGGARVPGAGVVEGGASQVAHPVLREERGGKRASSVPVHKQGPWTFQPGFWSPACRPYSVRSSPAESLGSEAVLTYRQ